MTSSRFLLVARPSTALSGGKDPGLEPGFDLVLEWV
jgi:hypothetical protein